jgi:hypothetical protein
MKILKTLWASLPQLSIIYVLISLSKLYVYFNSFNVPIKYFMSISELGLLVMDDIFIMFMVFALLFLIGFRLRMPNKLFIKVDESVQVSSISKYISETIKFTFSSWQVFIVALLFFGPLISAPIFFVLSPKSEMYFILGWSMLGLEAIIIIGGLFLMRTDYRISFDGMFLFLAIGFAILFFWLHVGEEISKVKNGMYSGTKIYTSDSTFSSDKNSYFIGQTSRYVFFYRAVEETTTIISIDEVKRIDLKENDVDRKSYE